MTATARPTSACFACLRRSWLLGRLSGFIEHARHERDRVLRDVLRLPDDELVLAVAGKEREPVLGELEALRPEPLRAALTVTGMDAICRCDDAYPARLLDDPGGPAVLHGYGLDRLAALAGDSVARPPALAVVGARKASRDGLEVATALGRGLSAAGVTVVSGMALGIDSASHDGALQAGGRTVAVLACGADVAYPASKRRLHERLRATGAVVSELPPGTRPRKWCFPARNRTIAGLASATVVVEAAERSGSLITVDFAVALGRDVAAVPGSVLSWRSRGTNALLRDGATLIREVRDALDLALGVEAAERAVSPGAGAVRPAPPDLDPALRVLLDEIDAGRDTVGRLALSPEHLDAVLVGLGELELLGLIRADAGGRFARTLL